jgi:hypothetical protein
LFDPRKVAVASFVVIALAGVAAGCGGDDDQEVAPSGSAATDTVATTPPADSDGKAKRSDKGEGRGDSAKTASGSGSGGDAPETPSGGSTESQSKGPVAWGKKLGDGSIQRYGAVAGEADRDQLWSETQAFHADRAAGDWDAVCGRLAARTVKELTRLGEQAPELKGKGCGELLKTLLGATPVAAREREAEGLTLVEVRVDGDTAFVLFESAALEHGFLPAVKEGDSWKVSSIGGASLEM